MPEPEKPKMQKDDKLMTPKMVAEMMGLSVRDIYDRISEGYFTCYYPNGPKRKPVRIWRSSVIAHIEAFSIKI
jgi:predicted DNA-binding transcriptional regulator AlpA